MKIVKIKGGLGNQLFQYSFAKLLEEKTTDIVKLDFTSYSRLKNDSVRVPRIKKFPISLNDADEKELKKVLLLRHFGNSQGLLYKGGVFFEKTLNHKYYFEKNRTYTPFDKLLGYDYMDGYWLSWKNVDEVFGIISNELRYRGSMSEKTQLMIEKVKGSNSVFVGVRRGDYGAEINHYGSYGQAYYDQALYEISKKIKNPVLYIFSDDIEWVKNNLDFSKYDVIYREKEDIVDDFEEFLIMQNCKHFIIVNSTFHWWAARLSEYPNKIVIAPSKWFADDKPIDIIPPSWIKM